MDAEEANRGYRDTPPDIQLSVPTLTSYQSAIEELKVKFAGGIQGIYCVSRDSTGKYVIQSGYSVNFIARYNYRRVLSQVYMMFCKMQSVKARKNYGNVLAQLRLEFPSKVSKSVLETFLEARNLSTAQQANHDAVVMRLRREVADAFTITRNSWRERRLSESERSKCEVAIDKINNDLLAGEMTKMTEIGWGVRIERSLKMETFDSVLVQHDNEITERVRLMQQDWNITIGQSVVRAKFSDLVLPQLDQACTNIVDTLRFMRDTRELREKRCERRLAFLMGSHKRLGSESWILSQGEEVLREFLTNQQI